MPGGMVNWAENEYDTRVGVDLNGPEAAIQQASMNLFADMGVQPVLVGDSGLVRPVASRDRTPPWVSTLALVGGEAQARVQDRHGVVAAVDWSLDGKQWHPMR